MLRSCSVAFSQLCLYLQYNNHHKRFFSSSSNIHLENTRPLNPE